MGRSDIAGKCRRARSRGACTGSRPSDRRADRPIRSACAARPDPRIGPHAIALARSAGVLRSAEQTAALPQAARHPVLGRGTNGGRRRAVHLSGCPTVAPVHAGSHPARPGPPGRRAPDAGSPLLSSRHAAGRTRTVRREDAADPHRGRRPEPARDPRRAAAGRRLRRPDRPRRRRGPAPPRPGLAGPAHHRHAHAPHGRAHARPRGQGPRRPADHRPVRHRHRGLQGRPARRGRRGLRHQALPLPGAAGADPAGPPAPRRPRPAPAPGAGAQPGPRAAPPRGGGGRPDRSR